MQQSVEQFWNENRRDPSERRPPGLRRWLAVAMIGASFLGGMVGSRFTDGRVEAQAPAVVTTPQVNLVDGAGNLRGILAGSDESGRASLTLFDQGGRTRSLVGVQADGTPILQLHGAGGETRLLASVQGEDTVLIVGRDGAGQGVLADVQGRPILSLSDRGQSRLQLQLSLDGWPRLALSDAMGNEGASLSVTGDDRPELRLAAGGRPRALLTVAQGATVLNLSDANQTRMVAGVASDGSPSVSFLDAAGEVTTQLPQPPQ